jgi:hypothetical protein
MIHAASRLLTQLRTIHEAIRETVTQSGEQQAIEQLSAVVAQQAIPSLPSIVSLKKYWSSTLPS